MPSRIHPAFLVGPFALVAAGLLVAELLAATYVRGDLAVILWASWGALFLRTIWLILGWRFSHFEITSEELILYTGVLKERRDPYPLNQVTDFEFKVSVPGRLLGYTELILQTAAVDRPVRVPYLPLAWEVDLEWALSTSIEPAARVSDFGIARRGSPRLNRLARLSRGQAAALLCPVFIVLLVIGLLAHLLVALLDLLALVSTFLTAIQMFEPKRKR
jgi:hypothetical protein